MDTPTKDTSRTGKRATGYGRKPSKHDATMTEVAPGTPLGEFMRRYWHPVALSEKVNDIPQKLRMLGEDLVIFRDRQGRPGLLHARCAHRGTTLYYGKVEEQGIRCCYHGWLFSVDGRCLDQPCEADNGARSRDRVMQPWYPLQERYGLVWAYMGPPEKQPLLPYWDTLESVGPGEKIWVSGSSFGAGGDDSQEIVPCNWLQDWENIMDPFHIPILHTSFSGVQFVPEMGVMPVVTWEHTDTGMQYTAYRKLDDGREMDRVTLALFPHVRIVPSVQLAPGSATGIGWVVPVDDTNFRLFHAMKVPESFKGLPRLPGRKWGEMSEEERQKFPGDWEAQTGQGPISLHSEEHLATSDEGIVMLRRMLKQQIKIVQDGGDPLGTIFDPAEQVMKVKAGNFFKS